MTRACCLLVALWLQVSPVIRWACAELSSGNLSAIVVRIGGISAALLGGAQAVSGASTSTFDGPFYAGGMVGQNFSFPLRINSVPAFNFEGFSASGLPPGVFILKVADDFAVLTGTPTVGGTFSAYVTGHRYPDLSGESITDSVEIVVVGNEIPATVSKHPTGIRRLPGTNAVFIVVASGTEPIDYHWFKGANPLAAANSPTLTLTNLTPASAGAYSVIVSNSAGYETSASATLSIAARPVISPSRVGSAVLLGFTGETGVTYRVESSSNITATTWITLTNLTPLADGPIAVTNNPASTNLFYRLRLLGP